MIYVKRGITVVVLTYTTTSSPPFTSGKAEKAKHVRTRGKSLPAEKETRVGKG